ncbi:GNAT family N-acetyltransferase [Synechococcus sp. PCC 7336]|uniref:GNAT family N-acetyltransferase n=1 Tax=Synechococcus sp. PCC 7336 TaxID=195250 RepID=UPI001930A374|nr:GNAT family N-acetyltransferase [Synechococcus sp. PCC 7336]
MYRLPEPLAEIHGTDAFDCGDESLNDWLQRQSRQSEQVGNARTYVVCVENVVVGFYCLAAGSVVRQDAIKPMQRNAPDPIPAIVLGRLAIDLNHQGQGLGRGLVKDALLRGLQAANVIGARAFIVHALSDRASSSMKVWGSKNHPSRPKR